MFLIFIAALAYFTRSEARITDCGKGKSLFKVDALGFWPDPAIKNENSTISFLYTVPGPTVTGGTATTTVTYNFIPLTPTVEDLCKNTVCPILPGQYNQSSSSIFPDGISGGITIKIEWKDQNNVQLLCALVATNV